jgi:hypothetical protein
MGNTARANLLPPRKPACAVSLHGVLIRAISTDLGSEGKRTEHVLRPSLVPGSKEHAGNEQHDLIDRAVITNASATDRDLTRGIASDVLGHRLALGVLEPDRFERARIRQALLTMQIAAVEPVEQLAQSIGVETLAVRSEAQVERVKGCTNRSSTDRRRAL